MATKIIKISAIGPYGINSGGVWYKMGKGINTSQFTRGNTYSVEVTTSTKGAMYINQVIQNMGTAVVQDEGKLLNPDLNSNSSESPKVVDKERPLNEYGKPVSDYALSKDQRIARSGVIQAAVQAMSTHVSNREQLEKESIALAEAMLKWVKES